MTTLTAAPTMTELLIEDAKPYGAKAVAVKPAEWGGYYVTILGGRVSQIFDTEDAAQTEADRFIQQIVTAAPVVPATITKEIKYNHGDYDMYLNGEYVGSAACYHSAEVELDRLAFEQLDRAGIEPELLLSATALDGVCSCGATFNEYGQCEACTVNDPARLAAQDLIASSFLARVPDIAAGLVRDGMEPRAAITRAIEAARTHEERLCLMMIAPELSYAESEAAEQVRRTMCERLYRQFRAEMAATNPDPAECPSTTEPRPVEDLPAATYPAWLLGLPDVAPAALPDPCFILPDGAATQSIILCIGGVSRVVSAQGVAEALALASVHMRK